MIATRPYQTICRLLCFLSVFASQTLSAQFREIYNANTPNEHLNSVYFVSPSTGYAAFTTQIGFTQDSGHSFTPRPVTIANTNMNGYSVNLTFGFTPAGVHAFTTDSLLAYGDFGAEASILFSSNGGLNWKLVYHRALNPSAGSATVSDLQFPANGSTGIAVHDQYIIRSTNRGQSWSIVKSTPSGYFTRLSFPTNVNGFAVAGKELYRTSDAGATWMILSMPPNSTVNNGLNFNNVSFVTQFRGYMTRADNNTIYKSIDGGSTWTQMCPANQFPLDATDLVFRNDTTGYFTSRFSYEVYKTSNSGATWEPCRRSPNYQYLFYGLKRLFFLDNTALWATGRGGYLMLSADGLTPTRPRAFFDIDTSANMASGTIQLINRSRGTYSTRWLRNGVQIAATYNASYIHPPFAFHDTLQLIVTDGIESDTTTKYQDYNAPVLPPPTITSFTPASGGAGTVVTITGDNFYGVSQVLFGGYPAASFSFVSNSTIVATVGAGATGVVTVVTYMGSGSKPGYAHPGLPVVSSFSPQSAGPGARVAVSGININDLSTASVGGMAVDSIVNVSGVLAYIYLGHTGASGVLQVTNAAGTVSKAGFTFLQPPTIASFAPLAANPGATITITGANFALTPAGNQVYFGGVRATVLTASANILTVNVPPGSSLDAISVTANGATARTARAFTPTFANSGPITANSFEWANFYRAHSPWTTWVSFHDLDQNGTLDWIASTPGSGISLDKNSSVPGQFGISDWTFLSPNGSSSMNAVADLDGDGRPDVVTANNTTPTLSVFRQSNTPSLWEFVNYDTGISLPLGGNPNKVVIADMNDDGKPDLVAGYASSLVVVLNHSTPGVPAFGKPKVFPMDNSNFFAVSDLDGNGRPEVISGRGLILKNTGAGSAVDFNQVADYGILPGQPTGVVAGDLNGDGLPDLVFSRFTESSLRVYLNTSAGGNLQLAPPTYFSTVGGQGNLALGDVDGDGRADIVVSSNRIFSINIYCTIFRNTSMGGIVSFATPVNVPSVHANQCVVVDLDGDGKPEIAAVESPSSIEILTNKVGVINAVSGITPAEAGIRCYPSPALNTIHVDGMTATDQWQTAMIYSADGKLISGKGLSSGTNISITVQSLPSGTYLLQLTRRNRAPVIWRFTHQ